MNESAFVDYVAARRPQLFRTACLICGDPHRAEDVVQDALTRLYTAWDRVERMENIDGYVRSIVVNAHYSERRRRWRRERPSEPRDVPLEPGFPVEDADVIRAAVGASAGPAPSDRAAPHLEPHHRGDRRGAADQHRNREEPERRRGRRAPAGIGPGLRGRTRAGRRTMNNEHDVLSQLVDYHDHISAPHVPLADDIHRGRRRVRRNRGLLAGGVALALVSVVAAGSMFTSERSADLPQPADRPGLSTPLVAPKSLLDIRELGFHVEPVPDVVVTDSFEIDQDRQLTNVKVKVFGDDGETDLQVAVYYQGRSPELPSTGTSEAVTVNGAAGTYYVEERRPDDWGVHLAWEYAPDSWAVVFARWRSAPPSDLRSKLLTAAEAVRSGGETVRIPVRIGTVPASLPSVTTAHGVSVYYSDGYWMWWLSFNDDIHLWATSQTGEDCQGFDGSPYTENLTYRGHAGCLVDGERIGLRLGTANAFFDYGDADPSAKPSTNDMKQVLADLTVGSADPTTWFDLRTALGAD